MTVSLQDDQTIIRYIRRQFLDGDGRINNKDAFLSRPQVDKNSPSYNWLEYFKGTTEQQLDCIRERARLRYHKKDKLAELNVGEARAAVQKYIKASDILRDPLAATDDYPEDPSHCVMTHIPEPNDPLADMIGHLLIEHATQTYPAIA